ncbi:MAG: phospholipid carrier-dependent glycosyltransferase [Gomphosphaeria aponina SAG 52.96 = DSM 107014]|uniref:Phospholipid carrier-dependent glycosyltransferase n=1 Tax=Gomphosphaeria aponina SAG 52.96 = DSM 107014 TaxID=1521640 RepID=A0A941GX60_9CHRO|nr:phospholipid carrier-dependent glycosyltransferase [Gomphosphaeria aponina SAG 52.96 = DSM 107014]
MKKKEWIQGLWILGIIWLGGILSDRFWFLVDNTPPAWDQADYLNGAINYWHALQTPEWLNSDWWRSFWLISSKIPPFTYILTAGFINFFGTSPDAATLVMLPFSAMLLFSVYGLGVQLFNVSVGLWAAFICQLLPGLYRYRLEFLLDYPLTSIVTFSFFCLTFWKFNPLTQEGKNGNSSQLFPWLRAVIFGLSLGIALMVKQTALFFLILPIIWAFVGTIFRKKWDRLAQLFTGLCCSVLVFYPWYRTNWLLILTSGKRATLDSAIAEGDPPLNTLAAWTYYSEILPFLLSWPLLLVPIVGLLIYWGKQKKFTINFLLTPQNKWLAVFLLGGYFLSSLNINKDARYILPLLPVLSLILARGLLSWKGKWQHYLPYVTVGLALLLMLLNLFPLPGAGLTNILSPRVKHYPYLGEKWYHQEVVEEIIKTSPYLQSNLGVLPSTEEINQHNFSYYGKRANFQVSGRQVGVREEEVEKDGRSLDWFLTKTGDQGSVPEAQTKIVNLVETGGNFTLQKSWQIPDHSTLKLYHRIIPAVEVQPLNPPLGSESFEGEKIKLEQVTIPPTAPPGVPVPVTYEWSGSWAELESAIVLLTWESDNFSWLHDHGIGMGTLYSPKMEATNNFKVIERMAMLPPSEIKPGNYTLKATYLNRQTGETYPISVPDVTLNINNAAPPTVAPELDLVTQLRILAPNLRKGPAGLEPIFTETARINQYDPIQDYLVQGEIALSYRLETEKEQLDWVYTIALSRVLQQDVKGAIASIKQAISLDSQNPYNYAYLAFVYLYDWRGKEAEKVLQPALKLNPDIPELITLDGVAAFMQGNLIKAYHQLTKIVP